MDPDTGAPADIDVKRYVVQRVVGRQPEITPAKHRGCEIERLVPQAGRQGQLAVGAVLAP